MCLADNVFDAVAALEALAKIGADAIAALTIEALQKIRNTSTDPVRPLEEMLKAAADARDAGVEPERCDMCGEVMEKLTGCWACLETYLSTAVAQLDLLLEAEGDGVEDLFNLMDEAQLMVWEIDEAQEDMVDGVGGLYALDGPDEADEVADWEVDRARADMVIDLSLACGAGGRESLRWRGGSHGSCGKACGAIWRPG